LSTTIADFTEIQVQSCRKCSGALIPYDDEIYCMNCGTVTYPSPPNYDIAYYDDGVHRRKEHLPNFYEDTWRKNHSHIIDLITIGKLTPEICRLAYVSSRSVNKVREILRETEYDHLR
jgi:hypothetical protein